MYGGETLDGESTTGEVEYWFDQQTVWVQWPEPDGRSKEVKFKNKLTDERWQQLRQPRGGVGGWSSQPGADAIRGTGTVATGGQLSVAGQPVYVGRTLDGVSTTGEVEYWFDQQTVWVKWPDGRCKEVKLTDELSDERWQQLRQVSVGGWSSQPRRRDRRHGHGDIRWAAIGRRATGVRRHDTRRRIHHGRGRVPV